MATSKAKSKSRPKKDDLKKEIKKTAKRKPAIKGEATLKAAARKIEDESRVKAIKAKKADAAGAAKDLEELKIQKKKAAYYYAVGRRKRAVAKVFLFKNGEGRVEINGRDLKDYFPWGLHQVTVNAPLLAVGQKDKLDVKCVVKGGGPNGQAEAVRLGIARALLNLNPVFRRALKKHSYLTRDPRKKERKKYGLKRARKAPQWKKR